MMVSKAIQFLPMIITKRKLEWMVHFVTSARKKKWIISRNVMTILASEILKWKQQ